MSHSHIETNRTSLRWLEQRDLEAVHSLHILPETDAFNTLGIPKDKDETKSIIESWIAQANSNGNGSGVLVIEAQSNRQFIGLFGLKLSSEKYHRGAVWYKILPEYWNKGIATEVLIALLEHCFDTLKLHRVQAGCAVDNIGSIKVLEKVGMIREGRGRQVLPLKTGWSDNFEYAILDSDKRRQKE